MKKILFIDDDETFQIIMKHIGTLNGVKVDKCINYENASSMISLDGYDAVFVDQKLFGEKGTNLIKKLSERFPSMKFYIVTNYPKDDLEDDMKNFNVKGFIDKYYLSEQMTEVFNE